VRLLAVVFAIATLALACVEVAFLVALGANPAHVLHSAGTTWLGELLLAAGWAVLAVLVLLQRPGNRLAWLFLLFGLIAAVSGAGEAYAGYSWSGHPLPGTVWVKLVGYAVGELSWPVFWFLPQIYPDGRAVSARWRWLIVACVTFTALGFTSTLVAPGRLPGAPPGVDNPLGAVDLIGSGFSVTTLVFFALCIGVAASMVVRYRRADTLQRAQLRMFVVTIAAVFAIVVGGPLLPHAWLVQGLAMALLPVSFGVAILRHGLYDLDRLVSRTLAYGLTTGALGAVYLAVTAVAGAVFGQSDWGVAFAALAVAALFNPLRHALQRAVDRRFDRERYDAARTAEAFARRLREEISLDAVSDDLLSVVDATLAPAHASLWLRDGSGSSDTDRAKATAR
jgi:hypothetical protein